MALFGAQLTVSARRVGSLQNAAPGEDKGQRGAITLDNALKLIPGDAVSLFIAGSGLEKVVGVENWPLICFGVCLLICALLRMAATLPQGETLWSLKSVNWSLLIVTLVAFFVWAHAVSPTVGPVIAVFHGPVAGFFAMALGIVAPLLVKAT